MQLASNIATPRAHASALDALCTHCRQPLPRGARSTFCCEGCERVHELLTRSGLDRYYSLRGEQRLAPVGEQVHGQHTWLDALEADTAGQPVRRVSFDVQGIQCGACAWLIEALFRRATDGYRIEVNPALGRILCSVGPAFSLHAFVASLEELGYRLGPATKAISSQSEGLVLRTGICLALAANTVLLSATTYFGLAEGPIFELVQNISFALATLSALVGGSYFVDRAYQGLRRGVLHLDLPIAVGMGLAYAGSAWSVYFGGGHASYLDTVSVFIALMLVGRLLQERLVEKNRRQLLASDGSSGLLARRVRDGRTELVPCPTLLLGDELLVCPGEIVPVRARLEDNHAECSLDWINGESEPRTFVHRQELPAGAINVGKSALSITALASFERSDLDVLLRDDASHKARSTGDFWDLLSRIYVVLVLVATAVGAAIWLLRGAPILQVLDVCTAVLVVTCPCAFGIATPLAYELAVSGLRNAGLFVRDGSFFDRAASIKRIVFDKTGTLTTGSLVLRTPEQLSTLDFASRQALYDLSARSNHPKSMAVANALRELDDHVRLSQTLVTEMPGRGLELSRAGVTYRFGEPRWATGSAATSVSCGPVLTRDGVTVAVLESAEVSRPDAVEEAHALVADGYTLWIASGDEQSRVDLMANTLGIQADQAIGNLSPEAKCSLIADLDRNDTLMIGDGINDGPALSRARCSGTPAVDRPFVPARADFYFLTPGLAPVRVALRAARAVRKVVRHALAFATLYNVFAVALCYAGLMRPWLAAVLMPASSLLVLGYTAFALSPRRPLWRS